MPKETSYALALIPLCSLISCFLLIEVAKELMSIPDFGAGSDDIFEQAHEQVKKFKKAILMVAGSAAQKLMMQLAKEQEILMCIADMAIETYVAESILLLV